MNLKGKFVRREGTLAIFSSRKGEWKPIEISGNCDPMGLQPGVYYELFVEGNRLNNYQALEPMVSPSGAPQATGRSPSGGSQAQGPAEVPRNGLMASATGVLKSLLEGGMAYEEAEALALRWAGLWGQAPRVRVEPPALPPQAPPQAAPAGRWTSPNSYSNAPPPRDPEEPPF